VIVPFTQNLVSMVFCSFDEVKGRLGRRPSGYGHTSRFCP
jgi:hypothetical protein